jgi:hypothetical protein
MKFVSLAVLALIGDEMAIKKAQALKVARHEMQASDYYDRSFDEKEGAAIEKAKTSVNKFDGLVHAQNGKVYDPENMKEVELTTDSSAVQLNQDNWYDDDFERTQTFTGEPIATVQQKMALLQTESSDLFDRDFEAHQQKKSRVQMNKFDGLFHAPNGKVYDQAGKEVVQQLSQDQNQDWCDSGIKGTGWCDNEESKDLNEKTKQQKGLMFAQREKKGWCDKGINSETWCDEEVKNSVNVKTVDDKSLYEGPTKAAW